MGRAGRPKGQGGSQIRGELPPGDRDAVKSAEQDLADARAAIDMPEASPVRVVEREPSQTPITPEMAFDIFAGAANVVIENANPLTAAEKIKGAKNKRAADQAARSTERVYDRKMIVLPKSRQKLRDQTDRVWRKAGAELNIDPKAARKAFAGATGLTTGLNMTKAAYIINPKIGLTAGTLSAANSYRKWNRSGAWKDSNLGNAMARNLGTSRKDRIRPISGYVARSAVPAVATAAAAAATFNVPMWPVTALTMGGYAAGKTAMIWRDKRALDQAAQTRQELSSGS